MSLVTRYSDRLHSAIQAKGTPALVGLDPRYEQLPLSILAAAERAPTSPEQARASAYEEFCRRIIDVVAPLVPAVKPQVAFFEECGPPGMQALWSVIRYAREQGLLVIADGKRGDIGSTALGYARAWLAGDDIDAAPWGADALTVNPYLGVDTLEPFAELADERGAGLYVLVRTSNPGSGVFQNHEGANHQKLFERVAESIEHLSTEQRGAHGYGPIGAVVGATYPAELQLLRNLMPSVPLLVPGYGSQGGTSADVASAFDQDGMGAVVNSSRGIIFAWERKDYRERFTADQWEDAVLAATREMVADLAANTPAGKLVQS